MAGILNNKQRILDAIFTVDGRRQMAAGTMEISFVSFTDEGLFYSSDDGIVANPGDNMICLEATSLPRDVIIPEADDDGAFSLSLADNSKMVNGRRIISGSETVTTGTMNAYSGSLSVMQTAMYHFDWQQIIGTAVLDPFEIKKFKTSKNSVNLKTDLSIKNSVDKLKPILFDDNLSHMVNLKYLPPEYMENNEEFPLGNYPKITSEEHTTYDTFEADELDNSISSDDLDFHEVSETNNLLGQCFEITATGVTKMAIIDYGEFREEDKIQGRVFYLGKIVRDAAGTPKFIRVFTLVFK
jgi:hypothetical protein